MSRVRYFAPRELEEAQALLVEHGDAAKPLAGGTDLLVLSRAKRIDPTVIVDLKALPLRYLIEEANVIRIGALSTHSDLAANLTLRSRLVALPAASRSVGGPALRNRGTVGGNIVNASPAADAVPPLLAADAEVVLNGPAGERRLPLAQMFTGYRRTALEQGELLTEIEVPLGPDVSSSTFVKSGNREAMIIASVNLACRLSVGADGRVTAARLCYGSVAPTPVRLEAAELVLVGSPLDELELDAAAEVAARALAPISDTRASATHRLRLVTVHTRRALVTVRDQLREQLSDG